MALPGSPTGEPCSLVLVVEPTRVAVPCPRCGGLSRRRHSRYQRRPLDLPWRGRIVRLLVHTRRWFCDWQRARGRSSPNASMVRWPRSPAAPMARPSYSRRSRCKLAAKAVHVSPVRLASQPARIRCCGCCTPCWTLPYLRRACWVSTTWRCAAGVAFGATAPPGRSRTASAHRPTDWAAAAVLDGHNRGG